MRAFAKFQWSRERGGSYFHRARLSGSFMPRMGRGQYLQVRYNAGRSKGDRSKKHREKRRKTVLPVTDRAARMGTKMKNK